MRRLQREAEDPYEGMYVLDELVYHLCRVSPKQGVDVAKELHRQARSYGDEYWVVRSNIRIGQAFRSQSDFTHSSKHFKKAWKMLQTFDDCLDEKAIVCVALGDFYFITGEVKLALPFFKNAMQYGKEIKDWYTQANSLCYLGAVYIEVGDYMQALDVLHKASAEFKHNNYNDGFATTLVQIGQIYLRFSDWEKTLENFRESLSLYKNSKNRRGEGMANTSIGIVHILCDRYREAAKSFKAAMGLLKGINYQFEYAEAVMGMGRVYLKKKDLLAAKKYFEQASQIFQDLKSAPGKMMVDIEKAQVHLGLSEWVEAINLLRGALKFLQTNRLSGRQGLVHKLLARAYEGGGDLKKSLEHYKIFLEREKELLRGEVHRQVLHKQVQESLDKIDHERVSERLEKEALQYQAEYRAKELAAVSLRAAQTTDLLQELQLRLMNLENVDKQTAKSISTIFGEIQRHSDSVDAWSTFERQLHNLDQEFVSSLMHSYPTLTPAEIRVCSLLRINMSNKEIASLLNLSDRTIDTHRTSIRKKIGLKRSDNLVAVLSVV
ncbi:MAG: LuxR C-terminal-related transcriptional regulator [Candidatus Kapaibacterium sp.]